MHYKTKSLLTITFILLFMLSIGVFVNNLDNSITGAAGFEECECEADIDCNDNNACTEDFCIYADSCEASLCVNKPIAGCNG